MMPSSIVSFSWKRWCCGICTKLDRCLARIALLAAPTPKNSGMSLIEQGDTPHQVNQILVQPEPSAVTHPNGRSQLDTPTLLEETDKGSLVQIPAQSQTQIQILALTPSQNLLNPLFVWEILPCLCNTTCLRVERIRLLPKRLLLRNQTLICLRRKSRLQKKRIFLILL